jgi:hypothetical protein
MKLRHAAALALMSWYLIDPPAETPDPNLPLSEWEIVDQFNSKAECVRSAEVTHAWAKKSPDLYSYERNPDRYAKCVSSKDPGIKDLDENSN